MSSLREHCGKPFPTPSALAKHAYIHSDNLLECDECDKGFPLESQLRQHKISHDEVGEYECTECDRVIKNKSDFKKHMRAHEDITLECDICNDYTETDIRNLTAHKKTHDGLLWYVCKYCGKGHKHYNRHRRHMLKPNACPLKPKKNANWT